ncbi:hypothetical protein Golax_023970 [Gossypium laxum]|uniref:Uncharacterized protein n=1 Tax=Gossypium laxum TaxID=34288 RepID=A0A7J8ZAM5_9ROSI|nr:hypothetical protein [Gossypium laxum]
MVVRDANGGVLASKSVPNRDVLSSFAAEAPACSQAVQIARWRLTGGGLESRIKKVLLNDSRVREEDDEDGENLKEKVRFLLGTGIGSMTEMKE